MIGYRDDSDVMDSAARSGRCCPNCYSTSQAFVCEDGKRRCVQCVEAEDACEAVTEKKGQQ